MRDSSERLKDILEAINQIEKYSIQGREAFEENELIQSWFIRHLQIIGESARSLPEDFRDSNSDIPWSKIIGMRHILVHDYFRIDTDLVWDVIRKDIQELKTQIESILDVQK